MAIHYVHDDGPGIRRLGRKRFRYVGPNGRDVGQATRARIEALAIPPAWTDVWICPDENGHVQATGRDARGRKQYRYHSSFRARRERAKFRDLVEFGDVLGLIRSRVDRDLRQPALSRDRVVAAAVSLLDETFVRVGNESYARENGSFGLTTLRCKHVHVSGASLELSFVGKGGKSIETTCCDPRLAWVVRRCQELPGQLLFRYESDGKPTPITSTDVNEYLRDAADSEVPTAKLFRTWHATLLAATLLADQPPPVSERDGVTRSNDALREVAGQLGNTLAVCRGSYVHPRVVAAFKDGSLLDAWDAGPRRGAARLSADERRLLAFLRG